MLFQLKMVYQKEDLYALANAGAQNSAIRHGWPVKHSTTSAKRYYLFGSVLLITMGCFLIALPLAHGDRQPFFLASGAVILLLGLLSLFFLFVTHFNERYVWRNFSSKDTEALVEFCEDYFAAYLPTGESRTSYSVIQSIFEDQAHYFLFVSKSSAVIICKDGFTVGDPNEFGTWIAEKTGEEIKKLR